MKFSTRHDIAAPIEFVFQQASDFGIYERQALRRGINVHRVDKLDATCAGIMWHATFSFRGKSREANGELTRHDPPNAFLVQSVSGGVVADFDVEFLALSRNRTRVRARLDLLPKTLSARLLVQSLKFAKSSLDQRFAKRLGQFGQDIERRYIAAQALNIQDH